ncbi:MAG: DUF4175 domain-containing protein, partial [Planctomycetota bacterium]|nr:DUF4175 domain-containing protein [Planctomycetota bacterium]
MTFAVHLLMAAYLQADYFRALAICLWAPPPAPAAPLSIAEVRPGDVEVVEGDPVGISALVRPADSVSSAFVETDSWLGGEGVRVRMRRGEGAADPGGADRWTVRFPAVLKSFRYRIAAEPERPAAMWPFRPADRPAEAVVSAWHEVRAGATLKAIGFRAAVSPPPYTGEAERVSESPFFEALWGSSVRIEVVASREDAEGAFVPSWGPPVLLVPASGAAEPPPPVRRNPGAGSGREADPGGKAGARVGGAQPAGRKRMSVEFQAGRGGEWEIRLSPGRTGGGGGAGGVGGAGNAVVIRGAVTVRMDRPPAVFCRIPDGAAIGERGLPVELRVSDDFGISDAALIVSKSGGVSAAYDVPAVRGRRELARTMYIPGEDLVPGETVEYVLQARDNFPDAPQVARTEPKKFTVPKAESGGPMFGGRRSLKRPGRVGEGLREPGGGGAAGGAGGAGGTAGGGAGTGRSGGGSGGAGEGGNAGTQRKTLRSGPERLEDMKNAGGETGPGGGDDRRRQGGSPGAAGSPSEYEAPSAGSPEDDRRRASGGKDGRGGGGADGTGSGGRSPAAGGEGRADGNDKGSGGGKGSAEGTGADPGASSGGTGASGSGGGTDTSSGSHGADKAGGAVSYTHLTLPTS